LWPIKDIDAGQNIFRDYLNGIKEERQRSSRLAIWYKLPGTYYKGIIKHFNDQMFEL
jgi:tubulin--tyrosine ligase-like protein 12